MFPAVCCLRIVAFPVSSSGTPVPQREMKRERERTVDRRTERKREGIRAWWNEPGESRAFPSKLWNLFLEETQRTSGKPGGYLSKRLRNNCSAIRMPRTRTTFPYVSPLSFSFNFIYRKFHSTYRGCAIINFPFPTRPPAHSDSDVNLSF